ncbi:MAG: chemotaxis protein CheR, partial [Myxococcales bacterium]|nr:chemotaxis protein CheR [Myxococcales bacterium]
RGAAADAARWAEQWVALEPSSAPAHYLLGHLRGAEGRRAEAAASLRRALYFDPSFALASFGLAELVAADGRAAEARGFLLNALEALAQRSDREVLPGSDEITAEWLRRIITSRLASARDAR